MAEKTYERRVLKPFKGKKEKNKVFVKGDRFKGTQARVNELSEKGFVSGKEIKTMKDKQAELVETADKKVDAETADIKHIGGGNYELPNGETVKGKENALKALQNGGE